MLLVCNTIAFRILVLDLLYRHLIMNRLKTVGSKLQTKYSDQKKLALERIKNFHPMLLIVVGFLIGTVSTYVFVNNKPETARQINQLRTNGKEYTRPLLLCDVDQEINNPQYESLKTKLNLFTNKAKNDGLIESASIYFRDLNDASVINVNPGEKFIPASLNKIPVMMQILNKARNNPGYLETKFKYLNDEDANFVQIIKPKESLKYGETYTYYDALEKMIIFSDNASYNELTKTIDYDEYLSLFSTLKIPVNNSEGISTYDYSGFFRVLYNATYLNRTHSEMALSLLTKSAYRNALVAGVPDSVVVAHKFGVSGEVDEAGKSKNRQLHDCGIFYMKDKNYLLCVMTKSNSEIAEIERIISEVSRMVYEEVKKISLQDKLTN